MHIVRPLPQIVEAKQREIARRYRRRGKQRHGRTPAQLAALRLVDLRKLFTARYGVVMPDDDAGREDIGIALAHIATLSNARNRMSGYLSEWAPWMTNREAGELMADALVRPQYWTADQLAWRLHLTAADRATLGITTIGAVDLPKRAREQLRKRKARERERARRAAKRAAACAP